MTASHSPEHGESSAGCECAEARAWRQYWTEEAIAERLDAEVRLYRRICDERWGDAMNDVRGERRMRPDPAPSSWPAHAELERRRAEVAPFPPR